MSKDYASTVDELKGLPFVAPWVEDSKFERLCAASHLGAFMLVAEFSDGTHWSIAWLGRDFGLPMWGRPGVSSPGG